MAKLFKNKIIKQKLETFQIDNFEKKLEIVQKWHSDYHTGTLKTDKEISRAPGWTQEFLGEVLGYVSKPNEQYTYEVEPSIAGQRPDFMLGHFSVTQKNYIIGELKDAKTSLDAPQKREGSLTPIQQAFKYKGNLRDSSFVIVSNFFETRLYYDNYLDYEMWTLDTLVNPKNDYFELKKFLYLLSEQNLIAKRGGSNTKGLISFMQIQQKDITKKFYKEYSLLRKELFKDIVSNKKKNGDTYKTSELDFVLSKTQKIIDRIIFIHFCEDLDLLPQGKIADTVSYADNMPGLKIWDILKGFFEAVNSGSSKLGIPNGYNGGLFHKDLELEALNIGDEICKKFVDLGDYDFEDDLSVNILGHIFEQSISDIEELKDKIQKNEEVTLSKRKKDGVFYTPEYIVDYIVKNSVGKKIEDWEQELKEKHNLKEDINDKNYTKRAISVYSELQEKLQNITVLDPACGSGAFLVKVFDFLLAKNEEITKTLEDLGINQGLFSSSAHFKSILQRNIYGVDLNEESVEITKLSLWLKTAIKGRKLANLDSNIKCGNSLIDDPAIAGDKAFSWESEFPQIFQDGGFDVIVGNPPYVRQELLGTENKEYLLKKYIKTGNSIADLYIYFYELSLSLLKQGGFLSFITPNKWMERKYGNQLRKYFKELHIEQIINFGELKIFTDASTEPAIIIIKNALSESDINFSMIKSIEEANGGLYNLKGYSKNSLSDEIWKFTELNATNILKKFKNVNSNLEEYTNGGTYYGIKTGYNKAFIINQLERNKILEIDRKSSPIIKKMVEGDDFSAWDLQYSGRHMLATGYDTDIQNEYKGVYEFLNQYKEELIKRKDQGKKYWNLRACDYYDLLEQPKIIYYHTAVNHGFYYDTEGYYISANCYFIANADKYLQTILNSALFGYVKKFLFPAFGDSEKGGRVRLDANKMNKLPIKNIPLSDQTPFIEKADFMLENNKVMGEKVQKFLKRVQGTFELEKFSKKLQVFYELSFEEFVKELKKVKVVLSLKNQDEWEEYFDSYKTEIVELKTKIDACDREIDEMVFDLYELSEEEREIVINS